MTDCHAKTNHDLWIELGRLRDLTNTLTKDNERLRADWREKDHAWIVRAEEYGAEIEQLRADWQLAVKIAEAHALDNERLRAALEEIMRTDTIMIYTIAQRALDGHKRA